MSKLNLGCGFHKLEGWLNVDRIAACEPDRVVDLEALPWPFETGEAEEVLLRHVLEHLGAAPDLYLAIMRELYRVCRADARVTIVVPHPRHDDFLADPTHVRAITLRGLELFDQQKNRQWGERGRGNSPLGVITEIDFEIVKVDVVPDEPWRTELRRGKIKDADFARAIQRYNNVLKETEVVLRAVKPARVTGGGA
jgi:hypothetical protein